MAQDAVVKLTPTVPAHVPGFGMAELLKHVNLTVRSAEVLFSDTTVVNLIELPPNALITNAVINVTSAFDGTGTSAAATATLSVPNDSGALVIWDAGALGLGATGIASATVLAALVANSGGFAILNYTPGTTTAGALEVYLSYVPDVTKLV